MRKEGRDYLDRCPKRKASRAKHETSKKARNSSSVAVSTDDEASRRQIAAIINVVMQATRHENDSLTGSTIPTQVNTPRSQMPQYGPHARVVSQVSTSSQRSRTQYDHNVNIIL